MKPTIVIVGRPNVGKSTLFNRLTKTRDALVADIPGLTRDRHYGHGKLGSKPYLVVDTGGFEPLAKDGIMHEMARQTEQAIAEADTIVFVVDGQSVAARDRAGRPPDRAFAVRFCLFDIVFAGKRALGRCGQRLAADATGPSPRTALAQPALFLAGKRTGKAYRIDPRCRTWKDSGRLKLGWRLSGGGAFAGPASSRAVLGA